MSRFRLRERFLFLIVSRNTDQALNKISSPGAEEFQEGEDEIALAALEVS
ncbi:hypothetical protein [Pseudomonas sp. OIL-1]|nr:hypothetical protein [Pseudomonas sp. OIL-1]QIB52345.1 hypothetical protein G3M63_15610 [Pseudomonas sp. OIL-1]